MANVSSSEYIIIDGQLYVYNKRENTLQPVIDVNAKNVDVQDAEEGNGNEEQASIEHEGMTSIETKGLSDNENNNNTKRWDDNDTLLLINLVNNQKEKFNNKRFVKREIYKDIATEMNKQGLAVTPLQCENKLKFLMNKYKDINDHNSTTGKNRRDWKFFNLMEEFMGDKDCVKPKAKCSSLTLTTTSQSQAPCVQHEDPKEGTSSSSTQARTSAKRRKLTPRGEMLKWLKDFEKKEEQREQERKAIAERHHEETMNMLRKFLEKN